MQVDLCRVFFILIFNEVHLFAYGFSITLRRMRISMEYLVRVLFFIILTKNLIRKKMTFPELKLLNLHESELIRSLVKEDNKNCF